MDKSNFSYKWERGRRFGIQSSNTLRYHPDVHQQETDTLEGFVQSEARPYDWGGTLAPISLDKHKNWELLNPPISTDATIVEIYRRRGGRSPAVVVNGRQAAAKSKRWLPKKKRRQMGPQHFDNPSKTISRASHKREDQREKATEQLAQQTPKDGQHILRVERNRPDIKHLHEMQNNGSDYYREDEIKMRRLAIQKEIKDCLRWG